MRLFLQCSSKGDVTLASMTAATVNVEKVGEGGREGGREEGRKEGE